MGDKDFSRPRDDYDTPHISDHPLRWSTDITYIRLSSGFVYRAVVIDGYRRYMMGWARSTTLDADFRIETLGNLLEQRRCEIFNTDQGSQFTKPRFTLPLLNKGIKVSMGRVAPALSAFATSPWLTGAGGHWTIFL